MQRKFSLGCIKQHLERILNTNQQEQKWNNACGAWPFFLDWGQNVSRDVVLSYASDVLMLQRQLYCNKYYYLLTSMRKGPYCHIPSPPPRNLTQKYNKNVGYVQKFQTKSIFCGKLREKTSNLRKSISILQEFSVQSRESIYTIKIAVSI